MSRQVLSTQGPAAAGPPRFAIAIYPSPESVSASMHHANTNQMRDQNHGGPRRGMHRYGCERKVSFAVLSMQFNRFC
jgi:hypothetical protein